MHKTGYQTKEIIKEYKKALQKLGINVKRVILYGSFARGTQQKDSDIDLVIVSNDFERMKLRKRIELLGIAAARIMKPIEAKGYTPKEVKTATQASFLKEVLVVGVSV
ncbi:MAG: nucleotidyltransferase domain-containing protein [Candidatus Omnitrophota bacterium]|nr:nucleotidyltransferase domain-containing protein [Candidatus Omnitrophota bacterium]